MAYNVYTHCCVHLTYTQCFIHKCCVHLIHTQCCGPLYREVVYVYLSLEKLLVVTVCLCFHREGIDWADIEWVDNAECLDLVERVRQPTTSLCIQIIQHSLFLLHTLYNVCI